MAPPASQVTTTIKAMVTSPEPRTQRKGAKGSSKSKDPEDQTERRRSQNRISQQCARKRQTAYTRHLESLVEAVKSGVDDDDNSKYSKLLRAHLKLMDEKLELEEALSRSHHKLISLGNMAIAAAEDDPFTCSTSPSNIPTRQQRPNPAYPTTDEAQATTSTSNEMVVSELPSGNIDAANRASDTSNIFPGYLGRISQDLAGALSRPNPRVLSSCTNGSSLGDTIVTNWGGSAASGTERLPISLSPYLSRAVPALVPRADNSTVINNSTVFADTVLGVARKFWMGRREFFPTLSTDSDLSEDPSPAQRLRAISSTAVEVIGLLAGLGPYIYGVKFADYMESVLCWRISNNPEDSLSIPPPFCPTPLQWAIYEHHVVIDFINWPSIRDQLIMLSDSLDLDAICREIVLNTVIELRHQEASIYLYELFLKNILPLVQGVNVARIESMLHDPRWIYLKVASSPAVASCPTEDALATEIANRMGSRNTDELLSRALASAGLAGCDGQADFTGPSIPHMDLSDALALYGVDRPNEWKVSRDFARKYPFIDCTGVVSKYETSSPASAYGVQPGS